MFGFLDSPDKVLEEFAVLFTVTHKEGNPSFQGNIFFENLTGTSCAPAQVLDELGDPVTPEEWVTECVSRSEDLQDYSTTLSAFKSGDPAITEEYASQTESGTTSETQDFTITRYNSPDFTTPIALNVAPHQLYILVEGPEITPAWTGGEGVAVNSNHDKVEFWLHGKYGQYKTKAEASEQEPFELAQRVNGVGNDYSPSPSLFFSDNPATMVGEYANETKVKNLTNKKCKVTLTNDGEIRDTVNPFNVIGSSQSNTTITLEPGDEEIKKFSMGTTVRSVFSYISKLETKVTKYEQYIEESSEWVESAIPETCELYVSQRRLWWEPRGIYDVGSAPSEPAETFQAIRLTYPDASTQDSYYYDNYGVDDFKILLNPEIETPQNNLQVASNGQSFTLPVPSEEKTTMYKINYAGGVLFAGGAPVSVFGSTEPT